MVYETVIRPEKEAIVAEIKEKLAGAKSAVVADYRGLTVAEVTELRKKLREAGVEYKVYKNTLVRLAAKETGLEGIIEYLTGPNAIAFGMQDPVTPAKILSQFAKDHKNLEIKAGILEGKILDFDGIKALAELPSKEVLVAKLLGTLQAPIVGLLNVLNGPSRKLVYALEAIRKQKEGA